MTDRPLPTLPKRDPAAHKGTNGTVAIIGGCATQAQRMIGAPALTARAALRAGCGLAKVAAPDPILNHILTLIPSATGRALPTNAQGQVIPHQAAEVFDELAAAATVLAIGPGLGSIAHAGEATRSLTLRAITQQDIPVVLDADSLNALAETPDFPRDFRAAAVLTPHPGEFRRLAKPLSITHDPTNPDERPAAAEALAQRLGCIAVLKGQNTVVSNGLETWTCQRGHPCLATAGTGDVLTGVIASLIAQYVAPGPRAIGSTELPKPKDKPLDLYDAARLAVELHAIAGERWAEQTESTTGLKADELADLIQQRCDTDGPR